MPPKGALSLLTAAANGAAAAAAADASDAPIYFPDTGAVSFPIKSADEFDISMTYLLLSARKMFAKMSENLNFIYYSAPSRATSSSSSRGTPSCRSIASIIEAIPGWGKWPRGERSWWNRRCRRQCNVLRASIYLSGLLLPFPNWFRCGFSLFLPLSSSSTRPATWVGFSSAAILCVCTSSSSSLLAPPPAEILRFSGLAAKDFHPPTTSCRSGIGFTVDGRPFNDSPGVASSRWSKIAAEKRKMRRIRRKFSLFAE